MTIPQEQPAEKPPTPGEAPAGGDGSSQLNPELVSVEAKRGARPGDTFVRVRRPRAFLHVGPGRFVAKPESEVPQGKLARRLWNIRRRLLGQPIATAEESTQRLAKFHALAVFGSDAISSSAYATQASLFVLMLAGNAALGVSLWTALAIAVLLFIVAFTYRQTVYAYPQGGGSYRVSRQNLGQIPGLIAAAALLVDYILTVAVSIVAGAQAVTSALIVAGLGGFVNAFPGLLSLVVLLSLIFIGLMVLGNLRGVRESGAIFAVPTYLFIFSMFALLTVGLVKAATGTLSPASPPPIVQAVEPLTLWLVLRAFSAGAVAMSGTEAISDGVPVFKPPESKNAATTLTIMATLLATFFLGISYLATHLGLVPGQETVISQIALSVFGNNLAYYVFQFATIGILVVAANTAFADFPRLSSFLARDHYMPHQFQFRGDRLAFNTGITFLGLIASLLIFFFRGNVESLINLYAIGVFLAFSLSNAGMVMYWWRKRCPGWRRNMLINGLGAVLTSLVLLIVVLTKFTVGGWIIVAIVPLIVFLLLRIHRHYDVVAEQLHIEPGQLPPQRVRQLVLVLVEGVNYASLRAFAFARTIGADVVALHVATSPESTEKLRERMAQYVPDVKLVVIESPTRSFLQPLMAYIDAMHSQAPDVFVTIVMPEFITAHFWERYLHNRTTERLRRAFERHPNVTLVQVPYLLEK